MGGCESEIGKGNSARVQGKKMKEGNEIESENLIIFKQCVSISGRKTK